CSHEYAHAPRAVVHRRSETGLFGHTTAAWTATTAWGTSRCGAPASLSNQGQAQPCVRKVSDEWPTRMTSPSASCHVCTGVPLTVVPFVEPMSASVALWPSQV